MINWIKQLFGDAKKTPSQRPPADTHQPKVPYNGRQGAPADNLAYLDMFREPLCSLYRTAASKENVIMLLVALTNDEWLQLIALLFDDSSKVYVSPESFTGHTPAFEEVGEGKRSYVLPKSGGLVMLTAIFAVNRDHLIRCLRAMGDYEGFIVNFLDERRSGHIPVVILSDHSMRLEHLPSRF